MNKAPKNDYLRKPQDKSKQYVYFSFLTFFREAIKLRIELLKAQSQRRKEPVAVFRMSKRDVYHPFDEDRFRHIVSYAVQTKSSAHSQNDMRQLSHNSLQRGVSINQTFPHRLSESMKALIEIYAKKLVDAFATWDNSNFIIKQLTEEDPLPTCY